MAIVSRIQAAARRVSGHLGRQSRLVDALRPWYESALGGLTLGRGVPWSINGVTFRIDPHHRGRFGHEYDAMAAAILHERIRPGDVCFNVGANVGVHVLQFAARVGPNGRVVAFEPNPAAMRVLRQHLELNELASRVTTVEAAVSDAPGEALLHVSGADPRARIGEPNREIAGETRPLVVPVTTLDAYCEAHAVAPDWLLVDVEGFERQVLRGARRMIAARAGRLGIVVEIHPSLWAPSGTTRANLSSTLDELGLSAIGLSGQADPLGEYGLVSLA